MKCLSSAAGLSAELLRHAKAALRRVWIHFSTQVKTIKEKERRRLLVGLVQPGRALSWPQKAAVNVCFQQQGRCWVVALCEGIFSKVLLQKFVFPLHVMCVRSPPPLCKIRPCSALAAGVLLARREKGPFPSPVEHVSVMTVFRIYLWHMSDVACRRKGQM